MSVVHINNLQVNFNTLDGVVNAVNDVNITVNKGEVVAIVGESGSGKSVTAMSILQLHPTHYTNYAKGSIIYENINLLQTTTKQIQKIRGNDIAMVFQEPMTSLNPVMPCGKQITEAIQKHQLVNYTTAKVTVLQLFEAVQLPLPTETFNKYPHQLSGGQKQRVMIAMAMSCNPKLLICDEPTTALDVTVQKNILQLLKQLQKQNDLSILFISHDLGLVYEIADSIVVMYKGSIVEQGTKHQIFTAPNHPYTKALLACRPALYPKGVRLPVVADFLNTTTNNAIVQHSTTITATAPSTTPLFEINNVTIQYPTKHNIIGKVTESYTAINNINFTIYRNEILGLVGESGCGKTTIGRALLQLQPITNGKIYYQNKNIKTFTLLQKAAYTKAVQMVFQDPYSSLNPRLTIGSAIAETILVNKICTTKLAAKQLVLDLLQKVELKPEHYNRYPHEFSGGQRQRIVIARALATNPQFMVCDESVSALDVSVQAQILNLLNDLKRTIGFTLLFISHDLSVVQYLCDRIIVMQKGEIVETNTATNIIQFPQHEYTKKLIAAMPSVLNKS